MTTKLGPYEIDNIYCGECAEMMAALPDNCIDLTVTSPPYDNVDEDMVTHSGKGLRDYQGYEWDFVSVAKQLWRVTKAGGVVVWVVGDATVNGSETGSSFRQALYFKDVGFRLADTMIFEKLNPPPQLKHTNRYTQSFDFMFVLSKNKLALCNYLTTKTETIRSSRSLYGLRNSEGTRARKGYGFVKKTKIIKNIWKYFITYGQITKDKIAHNHPAIFPESLARDHIISWSNPGAIVLDPFMGSGTVAKMAIEQGRHYLGFDISQEYVDLARQRVRGAKVPLPGMIPDNPKAEAAKQEALF